MNLSVGIVGLPNVGKSTLFNALLKKQQAFVANYPFATIEPNIGVVTVPDGRLEVLADIVGDEMLNQASPDQHDKKRPPLVPAIVKFVDIAGLVRGAGEGAGLGNKFLSHIREVSVIAHVVRAFEDESVIREGSIDPKSDYENISTELILADLQSLEKIKDKNEKIKMTDKTSILSSIEGKKRLVFEKIYNSLNKGIPVRDIVLTDEEKEYLNDLQLLTAKPEIVVLNVSEDNYTKDGIEKILEQYSRSTVYGNRNIIVICAKIEADLAELSEEEQREYLKGLGLDRSGLERLIQKAYETLGLISFFTTTGGKEVRAWTIKKGSNAIEAAGEIHTDFIKKFIKAEVVSFEDFVEYGGWKGAREKGKTRFEGRDYEVQEGDIIEFRIGS